MMRFLILGDGPRGGWFLEVRRPPHTSKMSAAEREHVTHRVLENMA